MMVVVRQSSRRNMWTEITRRKYDREGQRYASDLTDQEWALIEPHMPQLSVWADRARPSCGVCSMRSCISRGPAVSGRCCRLARRGLVREDQFCAAAASARGGGP